MTTEQPRSTRVKTTSRSVLLALFAALSLWLAPAAGFAQGSMSFGEEESEETDDADADDGETMTFGEEEEAEEEGGETMTFGSEDVEQDAAAADPQSYTLAVVALPSEQIDREQRIALQQKMREAVSLDPSYEPTTGAEVLNGLEAAGVGSCVTEPLCLSGVGQDAGVERILMGRVERTAGGLTLNVDLFDVNDKLFVKYTSKSNLSNFPAVLEAVEPAMKDIFDIRVQRQGPNYGDETDTGTVQRILAYTAAGLSVASLGAGIYYGMEASDGEDAILANQNQDGQFTITQAEADRMLRDVESDALTANVFYGASAGLAVLSGILFYVESGSDVGTVEDRRAGVLDRIDVKPQVGLGNFGLGASIDF